MSENLHNKHKLYYVGNPDGPPDAVCDCCQDGWPRPCPQFVCDNGHIHLDRSPDDDGVYRWACDFCSISGTVTFDWEIERDDGHV